MSNKVTLTSYHYLYLEEEQISLIPEGIRYSLDIVREEEGETLFDIYPIKGLFGVKDDNTSLLTCLTGEDLSRNHVDWFIIREVTHG